MIIQAVSLLEDLDKEINNYMMRLREWFGWHFPELTKIITDNVLYAKTVKAIGMRHKTAETDLSEILPEEIVVEVKQAAEISMGTEITPNDEAFILNLAQKVLDLTEYRDSLSEYLKSRMNAVAPNLTVMVGELVGAKLISHAGSLINLAKYPASTIQILGAEKALFRAMRTKHNTPKYGLIYQASLVGQASSKIKGKVSRTLAAKCSVCIRVDALGESENAEIGTQSRTYLESRVKFLESNASQTEGAVSKKPYAKPAYKPRDGDYNTEGDFSLGVVPKLQSSFVPATSGKRKTSGHEEHAKAEDDLNKKKKKKQADSDDE
jgi:nucleolar protein 58